MTRVLYSILFGAACAGVTLTRIDQQPETGQPGTDQHFMHGASQHGQLEHQAETAGQPFSLIEASLALSGGVQWNERQHGDPNAGIADGGFEAPRQGGRQLRPRPVLVDMNRALQWTL